MISAKLIKKELDQFYTKLEVAKRCYNLVVITLQTIKMQFIEPSAGAGSFLYLLPNKYIQYKGIKYKTRLGFDLDPKGNQIKKKDFLKEPINKNILLPSGRIIVIGNPPFGNRSNLAIRFFNRAAEYADTIAFIVPLQFRKWSVHSKLHKGFKLIKELLLDENSFTFDGKDYGVRCVFQIWTKLNTDHEDLRIVAPPQTQHEDFEMWQYNNTPMALKYFDYAWDFAVIRQGYYDYTKLITNKSGLNIKRQWIFFKAGNNEILQRLKTIDFDALSKNNTTVPGFGKADVVKEYNRLYN